MSDTNKAATVTELNPVIAEMAARKIAAKGKATKPTGKTASQQLAESDKATATLRKAMMARYKPAVATIDDAIAEALTATKVMAQATLKVEISHTGQLADSYADVAYFGLHTPTGNAKPPFTFSGEAKGWARQLVRYINSRPEFKTSVTVRARKGADVLKGVANAATSVHPQTQYLAAQMALLLAEPRAKVTRGYLKTMPESYWLPLVEWQSVAPRGDHVMAYCVERRILFPKAIGRPEDIWVITGDSESTSLRCLTARRVKLLHAIYFEGKKGFIPNLEMNGGNDPTGELYFPGTKRAANSGQGNTAGSTTASTSDALIDNLKAMALTFRDKPRKDWGELGKPEVLAALCAGVTEAMAAYDRHAMLGKSFCAKSAPGFDIATMLNVVNGLIVQSGDKCYVLHQSGAPIPGQNGKRGYVIGEHGSGILPAPKVLSELRKTA